VVIVGATVVVVGATVVVVGATVVVVVVGATVVVVGATVVVVVVVVDGGGLSAGRSTDSSTPTVLTNTSWEPEGRVSYEVPGPSTEADVAPNGQATNPDPSVVTDPPLSKVMSSPSIGPLLPESVTPVVLATSPQGPAFAVASAARS
jgi:hypothetical protein